MREQLKERLTKRIDKIVTSLEAEQQKLGWIKDRRGMRYLPTEMFLNMEDYSAGLEYLKWFHRNFPKDKGFPEFLLEWTIILFKTESYNDAKKMAFRTYCSNIHIFDKYFSREITPVEKFEKSRYEAANYVKTVNFKVGNPKFTDFDEWLKQITSSKKFISATEKFIEIRKKLLIESDSMVRNQLNSKERGLVDDI